METIQKIITDKQNSIEVGVNAKGDLVWNVKIYFNAEDALSTLDTIKSLKAKIEADFKKEAV